MPKRQDERIKQIDYAESGAYLEIDPPEEEDASLASAQYDAQHCLYDAVHGFHRTRLLQRLEYLMLVCFPCMRSMRSPWCLWVLLQAGSLPPEAYVHVCDIVKAFARRSLHHAWKVRYCCP